jgi:protein-S-isoprenylcysteine O-methyltransferase Ste14
MDIMSALPAFVLLITFAATVWRGRRLKQQDVIAFGFSYRRDVQAAAQKFWTFAVVGVILVALQGLLAPQLNELLGRPYWADFAPLRWAGAALLTAGCLLVVTAQIQMGLSWRVGVPEGGLGSLVTRGLFAYSRNPIFVGMFLITCGVFVSNPHLVSAILPPLAAVLMALQVRIEEEALQMTHGEPYRNYMARTPRWIWPFV